jgi:tRNA acetyltransferase TAN1
MSSKLEVADVNIKITPTCTRPRLTLLQFAIRPNLRNHSILSRDAVIKQVAAAVGPDHQVDLKAYDLLILIEIYQVRFPMRPRLSPGGGKPYENISANHVKNICGMSVVGSDFEELKRFNLAEIFDPTPLPTPIVEPERTT